MVRHDVSTDGAGHPRTGPAEAVSSPHRGRTVLPHHGASPHRLRRRWRARGRRPCVSQGIPPHELDQGDLSGGAGDSPLRAVIREGYDMDVACVVSSTASVATKEASIRIKPWRMPPLCLWADQRILL